MAKQILFGSKARTKMLNGLEKVARAVEITLGASGPGVVIQHRTDGIQPVFTRDGVTVALSLVLPDHIEDIGARMLRDVASAMSRQVGDGTTTAVVLARKIALECTRSLASGAHPTDLKKGIDLAVTHVTSRLAEEANREVTTELLRKVSQSASKEPDEVADRLIIAFEHVGINGSISVEMGHSREDRIEITEGAYWEQGFPSAYFKTNRERDLAELEHPYILLYDREITDFMDLVPLLEEVEEQQRSLLIIAENMTEKALAPLLLNHVRGHFRAVFVKPPGYGDRRFDRLHDLAILTGGRVCLEAQGGMLDRMTLADLGQADKAIISADSTTLLGCKGNAEVVADNIMGLERQVDLIGSMKPGEGSATGKQHELEDLEERIQMLKGKTAVYHVGGGSEMEMKERLVRIENASKSMRAALEEGVMAGGGIGLYSLRDSLAELDSVNSDQLRGIGIVRSAMMEPLRRIATNAGLNPDAVEARVMNQDDGSFGFDAHTHTYGNLIELGVVDPVKVTRLALKNAAGVVGTVITTSAIVCEEPVLKRIKNQMPSPEALDRWAVATREDPRV